MSYTYTREALLEFAPEDVFDHLTNQSMLPQWSPEVISSEVTGGGAIEMGTTLRQIRRRGKGQIVSDVEVVEHDRPRRHAVVTRILGTEARFVFLLTPEGTGTRVRMTGTVAGKSLSRLLERPLGKAMEKSDDRALERLGDSMRRE